MLDDDLCATDTIVAIATPPGRNAIGIVRLTGPEALSLCQKVFRTRVSGWPRHRLATLGELLDPSSNELLDQAVVCYYKAPRSYSGEDLVEMSLHGSPVVLQKAVSLLMALGARPARPGEFTLRAFLHGKLDLSQAEAVRDLIEAQTEYQSKIAVRQLQGSLAKEIDPAKTSLVKLIVQMETALEFADERLVELDRRQLSSTIHAIIYHLTRLIDSFSLGRAVRDGLQIAILGKPNVGKSSIFNMLLSAERAIVTELPGTTRDTLAETISLDGIPLRIVDTAGVRKTSDPIELMGIERTRQATADADLVLLVFDDSTPFDELDMELLRSTSRTHRLLILNKIDLRVDGPSGFCSLPETFRPVQQVSAKSGEGLNELKGAILQEVFGRQHLQTEDAIITSARHHQLLQSAVTELRQANGFLLDGLGEEIVLSNLTQALGCMGELTGETTVEDILNRIFATFCVGK